MTNWLLAQKTTAPETGLLVSGITCKKTANGGRHRFLFRVSKGDRTVLEGTDEVFTSAGEVDILAFQFTVPARQAVCLEVAVSEGEPYPDLRLRTFPTSGIKNLQIR